MNQVQLFGRLTRDPELKYTQSNKAVVNFSLAVNRYGGDEADFFECTAWDKQAENINNSCKKGHRLLIWGRLVHERWTDQQTQQNRSAVKITVSGFSFIEPPPNQQQQQQQGYAPPSNPPQQQGYVPPANYAPPGNMPPGQGYAPPNGQGYVPPTGQQPPMQPPAGQYQQPPAQPPANNQQTPFGGQWVTNEQIPF